MTSGAVIGLIPRVIPWQRTPTGTALDTQERVGASQLASSQLDAMVGDEQIVRAIEGDELARRAVFDAHIERVYRLAYRMTGDAALAEDVTQDVFARVFDRLHQFRGDAPFGAWLHRVATTTILNALRKARATASHETSLEEARYAATRTGGIEPDMRDRVRAALASLPEGLRIVAIMFDIEGYSHDEIAEVLSITPGASRVRLSRAREALRTALAMDAEEWSR